MKKKGNGDSKNDHSRLMTMPELCTAIENWQKIKFKYNGTIRIGEPQCYGITPADNEVVRIYVKDDPNHKEKLFEISKFQSLEILDEYFNKPGPNYKKNDSAMKIIFCQLEEK